MVNVDQLPIPDWDLHCPGCGAALAGLSEHRCRQCGRRFNIRQLLELKRPVPALDLYCEECGYSLNGLPEHRCPECGAGFSVRELLDASTEFSAAWNVRETDPIDHYLKKREPTFTGQERPLPDFGLFCEECGLSLAGAPADVCPDCQQPLRLPEVVSRGGWVNLTRFVAGPLQPVVKSILYQNGIPYLLGSSGLSNIYTGIGPYVEERLLVPQEFFFDALYALADATQPASTEPAADWTCPECTESVPGGFDVCWKCGAFRPESPPAEPS